MSYTLFRKNRAEHYCFRTSLSFVQPLDTARIAPLGLAQAQFKREVTVQDFMRRQQEVIVHVARAYDGVLFAQAELEVVRSAVPTTWLARQSVLLRSPTFLSCRNGMFARNFSS